jgi:predicted NUDIX family phosphoesterase
VAQVHSESVLVVPTRLFHDLGHFQGFSGDVQRYLAKLLAPVHTSYRPRDQVEQDPGFKQLIPYVILRHRDAMGREFVFQYTRGKGQGEQRLHSKRSIGIGGHISLDDCGDPANACGATAAYEEGMRRELAEEVAIESAYTQRCVGLINDDDTEVGRVHLGVVHVFDLEQPAVRPMEADIVEAEFRPVAEIARDIDRLETWSQICLRALFPAETLH